MPDINKTLENMSSAELSAVLKAVTVGGTTPDAAGNVKAKKPAKKPAAKKTAKAKKPAAKKPAAKKTAKKTAKKPTAKKPASKVERKPRGQVVLTAEFLMALKKPMSGIEIAKKLKIRPVEVHRAVARLESEGHTVTATRAAPTGKTGRRAFLFMVTKKGGK